MRSRPGGDPKEIAGQQFQFIMEQIRGNALPFFQELRDDRPILQSPMATLVARFRDVEEILHREDDLLREPIPAADDGRDRPVRSEPGHHARL